MRLPCPRRVLLQLVTLGLAYLFTTTAVHAHDPPGSYPSDGAPTGRQSALVSPLVRPRGILLFDAAALGADRNEPIIQLTNYLQQPAGGSNGSGEGSGGGSAGAAVNPTVPLAQLQLQNLFIPSTRGATGYSNQFILQPVLPLIIDEDAEFLPFHVVRPTLPIIAPSPNPDGPAGTQGGLGDLSLFDLYVQPAKHLKTNFAVGYTAVLPTRTHPQLGLGEWQLGPAAAFVSTAIPQWVTGAIFQAPFSTQSDAYTVSTQLIATRLLADNWYAGWGDSLIMLDNQNGDYDIPLSLRVGKVVQWGAQPLNIALQGRYTPEGFQSAPGTEWGIKLNVTLLFPKAKLHDPLLGHVGSGCCNCCCP